MSMRHRLRRLRSEFSTHELCYMSPRSLYNKPGNR
jgi:hypothetical protein